MDRLVAEQTFHDQQALHRAVTFDLRPELLQVDDEAYLRHESWIRYAFKVLGDIHGLPILDLGCGHAMAAVVLARRGALVTALDLSAAYLSEARRRAGANSVHLNLLQANGERLPFADSSFDRVWGHAILHHLDLAIAAPELRRVLRPGGIAAFCEPWGENPLLNAARRWLPYRGKGRTPDEQPLRRRDIDKLRQVFSKVEVSGFQLFGMLGRAMPVGRLRCPLESWDHLLLRQLPVLKRLCRYVVIEVRG